MYVKEKNQLLVKIFQRKHQGYQEDEKLTTHPFYYQINKTDYAQNLFDGITFVKGAVLIQQRYYYYEQRSFFTKKRLCFENMLMEIKNEIWINILSYTTEKNDINDKRIQAYKTFK
ncbi:unnamed protein product [Paramecium sonneborni]|uniref:Uncharacterized protein n=1 Tax=Paramecium sonneborni TaxID=65129 RepID=A0A8S1JXC7_9CILI|nr:unnamed protein product [Paramecium sonneborni]